MLNSLIKLRCQKLYFNELTVCPELTLVLSPPMHFQNSRSMFRPLAYSSRPTAIPTPEIGNLLTATA